MRKKTNLHPSAWKTIMNSVPSDPIPCHSCRAHTKTISVLETCKDLVISASFDNLLKVINTIVTALVLTSAINIFKLKSLILNKITLEPKITHVTPIITIADWSWFEIFLSLSFSVCTKSSNNFVYLGLSFANWCVSVHLTRSHLSCYNSHDRGTVRWYFDVFKILYSCRIERSFFETSNFA